MSKGGSSTTTQKADPWKGVQPYLTGQTTTNADGTTTSIPGVYPDTANLYQNSGWSDAMQGNAEYLSQLQGRSGQSGQAYGAGNAALGGAYDSNSRVSAQMVDPTQAFGSMGAANPTNSISQMLSGQANTSTLDPVVNSAMTRTDRQFQYFGHAQAFGRTRLQQVNTAALGKGIAEGLATKGLSQSMGDVSANMYNNAYNTAQGLMGSTANNMAGLR